jgi:hypothetical protein
MAKKILCSRGAFYESNSNPTLNVGMYQLFPPLVSPVTPVFFTSVTVQEADISNPNAYLNNDKIFHSFGKAWGEVNIEGEILLGNVELDDNTTGGNILTGGLNGLRLVEFYFSTFRASTFKRPIILSSLRYAKPIKFFLTHYTRGRANPEFNIVSFGLRGSMVVSNANSAVGAAVESIIG